MVVNAAGRAGRIIARIAVKRGGRAVQYVFHVHAHAVDQASAKVFFHRAVQRPVRRRHTDGGRQHLIIVVRQSGLVIDLDEVDPLRCQISVPRIEKAELALLVRCRDQHPSGRGDQRTVQRRSGGAARQDPVPIAGECMPNTDIAHPKLPLDLGDAGSQSLREFFAVLLQRGQPSALVLLPAVVDDDEADRHALRAELRQLGIDLIGRHFGIKGVPRAKTDAVQPFGKATLSAQRHADRARRLRVGKHVLHDGERLAALGIGQKRLVDRQLPRTAGRQLHAFAADLAAAGAAGQRQQIAVHAAAAPQQALRDRRQRIQIPREHRTLPKPLERRRGCAHALRHLHGRPRKDKNRSRC